MKKISFVFIILAFVGCQKIVDIDLNSTSPQIVIEGNITDGNGPYKVTVSKTVNFSEDNTFPVISGAFITITDNNGIVDTLIQHKPGLYLTTKIKGTPGNTYFLKADIEGKTYTSTSTMPYPVSIDSINLLDQVSFGRKTKVIQVFYQDPVDVKNYYRFLEYRDTVFTNSKYLQNDDYNNGLKVTRNLSNRGTTFKPNTYLEIGIQCIDRGSYLYFYSLGQSSGGPMGSSTPSNPVSNINGGCLGYFSAYTFSKRGILVP